MYKSVLAEERAFYEAIASMYHRTCELVGFVMCLKQEWIMQIEYL